MPRRLRVGDGTISGYLSIFLGVLALGGVLCFHFPQYLTTPEFRALYSVGVLRWVLHACLVLSFGFALSSFVLSGRSRLGVTGLSFSALAILLGGGGVEVAEFEQSLLTISLDWLLIDLLLLSAIFIPLELFLPQRADQTKFHPEWKTDLVYFAVSHLVVQYTGLAIRTPAHALFDGWGLDRLHEVVGGWPFALQLLCAMLSADLFQYAAHRAFHAHRILWRFHAVHHSIRTVDWLAGSRLHLVDVVITRAVSYLPLYLLGFSLRVFYCYVVIVALQAVAAHANVRIRFGWLRYFLVTPQFYHWHHSDDPAYHDKNFAIHFPFLDRLFGTYHLPGDEWPESTGLRGQDFPRGYLRQFIYPFGRDGQRRKSR